MIFTSVHFFLWIFSCPVQIIFGFVSCYSILCWFHQACDAWTHLLRWDVCIWHLLCRVRHQFSSDTPCRGSNKPHALYYYFIYFLKFLMLEGYFRNILWASVWHACALSNIKKHKNIRLRYINFKEFELTCQCPAFWRKSWVAVSMSLQLSFKPCHISLYVRWL